MCNLYSITSGPRAIQEFTQAILNAAGNLQPLPAVFPDTAAPIVRHGETGRELALARWGMPSPAFALKNRATDPGVTNIRNTKSPHWRRWLGSEHRCVVPFNAFSEYDTDENGKKVPVWFAASHERPLLAFAGLWTNWTSVRRKAEGEVSVDCFGFLTTEANRTVGEVHPKAMPVILQNAEDIECWMKAPWSEAAELQRPLPDRLRRIVARGERHDGVG